MITPRTQRLQPLLAAIAVTLLIAPSRAQAEGKGVLLRLRPAPGAEYEMTIQVTQDMSFSVAGEQNAMTNEQVMTAHQQITTVGDDGTVATTQTMERIRLQSKMGENVVMSFDSASEEESPEELAPMTAIVGKAISITQSELGEVLTVEGFDAIWDAVGGDDPAMQKMMAQLQTSFGEDAMRQQMQMYSVVYPEEPITVDEEWTHELNMSNPLFGSLVFIVNYRFLGVEQFEDYDCAQLAMQLEGDLDFDMSAALGMLGGGAAEMDVNADVTRLTGDGTICVALESGLARRSDMTFVMQMDMTIGAGEQAMAMAMDLDQTLRMSLEPIG